VERLSITPLLLGPPGVGKTHLAAGLGVKAIARGYGVCFQPLDDLIRALKRDANVSLAARQTRGYFRSSLLIVDELGFTPLDRREANLFFRLVNSRYERAATIITSNQGVAAWPSIFAGDETLTTAILDRLLHHACVLNIKGRSYRLKDFDHAARLPDASPAPARADA
jgi:DNA replication protein DnaC